MSLTSWFLVSGGGTRHRLPREMIFVGRDDCELMLQSRSVDKQHAVINYESNTDEHKVKDLGSLNGTFVNDVRIQEQIYVTLKIDDKLRFGYDTNLFTVVRGEMLIPEEALKHEKLSSQLQLGQKKLPEVQAPQAPKSEVKAAVAASAPVCDEAKLPEANKVEDKTAAEMSVLHRGTPLYGQPAWWGDGRDPNEPHSAHPEQKNDRKRDKAEPGTRKHIDQKSAQPTTSSQDPSYYEIPTKDPSAEGETTGQNDASSLAEPLLGHASFTIEFDPGVTGKVTVKDKVVKGGQDTRTRPKRPVGEDLSPLQTAMVAAEVKVADWLAQNELPLALKETTAPEEDGESAKSDVPVQLRSIQGSKHEDGTQSDTENALGEQRRAAALEERSWGLWGGPGVKFREGRANVPEGLFAEEDSPARRRKAPNSKAVSGLVERRHGSAHHQQSGRDECYRPGDDYSDRGTYTIGMEHGAHEEEEDRKRTYKVFGADEQESMCLSRLGGSEQRDRSNSQRSVPGERRRAGRMEPEVLSEDLMVGGPRWVSQWVTLAATHVRTDPEGSGGDNHVMVDRAEVCESGHSFASTGYTERKRRTLPQLPGEDIVLERPSGVRMDMGEKQDTELQEKESQEEKTVCGKTRSGHSSGGVGSHGGSPCRSSPAKSQDSGSGRSGQTGVLARLPPRPLSSGEKRTEVAQRRKRDDEKAKENGGKPLFRQESFTVERSSSNVPIELIPRIDSCTSTRISKDTGIDNTTLQKDTEAVAAFLETTVSDQGDPPSQSIEGSMSPESDVDTTSTVSQVEGARRVVQKRRALVGQARDKNAVCSSGKGPTANRNTSERKKNRTSAPQQPTRPWTSLDLTDDDVNSNSLLSDSQPICTQESRSSHSRAHPGGTTVGASTKTCSSRSKTTTGPSSAASKNSNVPKIRPTRASLLRRARLGESSDTEPADMDRMSVASEASTASSTSRTGMAKRGMSRIEALAQPRRPRGASPSAQSDSEATVTKNRLGARSAAGDHVLRHGLRAAHVTQVSGPRARANSASKLPDKTKGPSSCGHATPSSGTRWRRIPAEYASTSEDEHGSNRHTSRQGQTQPLTSTRVSQLSGSAPPTPGLSALKQNSREQDEYMRDWTAHSEEIARISQDLAKDLAMLAREIHDVAGEIDSVSPAATDPGARPDERVFDDSVDPEGAKAESNGRSVELRSKGGSSRSIRRQTWNREDAILDSLLLTSVAQLSTRIRQCVDKTTCKIRILFKDKERKWDEIESKLQYEHDSLLLKTSNKEISNVIQDLKKVERQLLVIDMMVDPDGTLDALTSLGLPSPLCEPKISPGIQQGAVESQKEILPSSALSGVELCGHSGQVEAGEQDSGVQAGSETFT
ncbi:centrosomal protein of 170 kDa [Eucyclogobius newberryi]|uniref:centrosomal protein of 170 kDa n=1 Tax=Eucyclogobius newberryi TaxID=166745 RepID=UPI003B5902E9